MPKLPKDSLEYGDAVKELAQLVTGEAHYTGTFLEFLHNVFKYSFDKFEVPWYLEKLGAAEEQAWKDGKKFLAVLPRMHSKSVTLGYAFVCWTMARLGDCSIMYISYRDEQARFHCAEIKRAIARNPLLKELLIDLIPEAEVAARFRVKGGGTAQIYVGGIFSAKRGWHVDLVICDDILSDPSNPLTYIQLGKVENHFRREVAQIPQIDGMMVVIGTPMTPGDLLHQLSNNEEYVSFWLPALNPVLQSEERDVLWETRFSKEWLERRRKEIGEHSFRAEFMLYPAVTTEAYFMQDELDAVIDPGLRSYSIHTASKVTGEIYGGLDVGKKRHPSALTFLERQGKTLVQVHQGFLDSMDYTDQVSYVQEMLKKFRVTSLYIDNTRGELEERGLPRHICRMIVFGSKSGAVARTKGELAALLEKRVNQRKILLLNDERLIGQLLSVDNNLKSPDSSMGHGDAFISLILAVAAHDDIYPSDDVNGGMLIGDLSRVVDSQPVIYNKSDVCSICRNAAAMEYSNEIGRCTRIEATRVWCMQCGKRWLIKGEEWIDDGEKTLPTREGAPNWGTWRIR